MSADELANMQKTGKQIVSDGYSAELTYDAVANILTAYEVHRLGRMDHTYAYDGLDQLIAVVCDACAGTDRSI